MRPKITKVRLSPQVRPLDLRAKRGNEPVRFAIFYNCRITFNVAASLSAEATVSVNLRVTHIRDPRQKFGEKGAMRVVIVNL